MKAITYIRYSSEEQRGNTSVDRQNETIDGHCQKRGLEVIRPIVDEAKSASKGHHILKGNLGKFLKELDPKQYKGQYRGFAFVVEDLSRFSRLGNTRTTKLMIDILEAGMQIHLAKKDKVIASIDELDELGTAVETLVDNCGNQKMARDHSYKVGSAKKIRKAQIKNGRVFTALLPAWLKTEGRIYNFGKLTDPGEIVEVTEAEGTGKMRKIPASTVKEIFRLAALGYGSPRILKELNGRGAGLTATWVNKTLSNRAVLGEYDLDGEIVTGYYPRIISEQEWTDARKSIDAKNHWDASKRKISFQNRRQNEWSLFGKDVVRDVTDCTEIVNGVYSYNDAVNVWFDKCGGGKNPSIKNPHVNGRRIRYDWFERAFRGFIRHNIDWRDVIASGIPADLQTEIDRQTELTNTVATIRSQIASKEALLESAEGNEGKILLKVLTSLNAKLDTAEFDLATITAKIDAERAKLRNLEGWEKLDELLDAPQDNREAWAALKIAIGRIVQHVDLRWCFGNQLDFTVTLINGVKCEDVIIDVKTGEMTFRATSTDSRTFVEA